MNNDFMRWACLALLGAGAAISQQPASISSGSPTQSKSVAEASAPAYPVMYPAASSAGIRGERSESPTIPVEDSLFFPSPGNRFRLRWWGVGSGEENLVVNTRWEVVLPDRGIVPVRGRTFKQVRASIDSLLRSQIRIKMLDLQLLEIGKAQVQVTGLVPNPGVIEIAAGERLTTVLGLAGLPVRDMLRSQAGSPPTRPGDRFQMPSVRHIQLLRSSGKDTVWCDIARAYNAGEVEQDPRVFSGDVIRVLAQGPVIAVSGDVPFAGFIEMVPGESVGSFVKATGLIEMPSAIAVMDNNGNRKVVHGEDLLDTTAAVLELPSKQHRHPADLVWIAGYVQKPGGYVYRPGMTARQLLAVAGGSLSADEDSSVLVGVKRGWSWIQAGRRQGLDQATQYPEVRQALLGYQLQMRGNYSDPDAPLQAGDSVVVHQAEKVVWVGGKVNRPGFVPWKRNGSYEEYIAAAGGFADRAWDARTVIYDQYTDQVVPLEQTIRPGSSILVPEKKYLYFDQWISLGATVVSTMVSIVVLYVTVSNK